MKLLLDTQVALWWLTASRRLSKPARELVSSSPCHLSVASIWEVAVKYRLGKLQVPARRFRDEMLSAGASILPIRDDHALLTAELGVTHDDPFDRLLLAVAVAERLTLLTADQTLLDLGESNPGIPVRGV